MTESKSQQSLAEREREFVEANPNRVLRQKAAAAYIGVTGKTMRVLERHGTAPPRVELGPNSVGYRLRDLDAWLDARTKQRTVTDA